MTSRGRRALAACAPALLAALLALAASPARHTAAADPPAMRPMPAGVDSGPSPDARRVLESIPEPLPATQRIAPSREALASARVADSLRMARVSADSARIAGMRDTLEHARPDSLSKSRADTLAASADTAFADTASIPVPAAVPTLADRAEHATAVDSALALTRAPDSTSGVRAAPVAAAECWGVQIGAPTEPAKAEALRSAAQSLLLVGMAIETDHGRHRVRTVRCLSQAAADSLRRRAVLSGFSGAFRFGGDK